MAFTRVAPNEHKHPAVRPAAGEIDSAKPPVRGNKVCLAVFPHVTRAVPFEGGFLIGPEAVMFSVKQMIAKLLRPIVALINHGPDMWHHHRRVHSRRRRGIWSSAGPHRNANGRRVGR